MWLVWNNPSITEDFIKHKLEWSLVLQTKRRNKEDMRLTIAYQLVFFTPFCSRSVQVILLEHRYSS